MTNPAGNVRVTLRDGTPINIRPIRPEDDHALVDAFHRMSPETVYQRFFAALPELSQDMAWHLSHVNYTNRMALVAELADDNPPGVANDPINAAKELIGVARYERIEEPGPGDEGAADARENAGVVNAGVIYVVELGLVVLDPWQNRGLGRILIRQLFEAAAQNGIALFRAEILSDNRRMLRLLATEAHILESKSQSGITTMLLEPLQR